MAWAISTVAGPVCLWYWINSLHNMLMESWAGRPYIDQKCGPDLFLRVTWWKFSLGKLKLDFTNHCLQFKPLSCRVGINWFWARESVKLTQNSFLQKFGCDICLFSSGSLYIFTLLMNEFLIATVKLSGVTSQQSFLPRPAGILLVFCSWLMEAAGVKHK